MSEDIPHSFCDVASPLTLFMFDEDPFTGSRFVGGNLLEWDWLAPDRTLCVR